MAHAGSPWTSPPCVDYSIFKADRSSVTIERYETGRGFRNRLEGWRRVRLAGPACTGKVASAAGGPSGDLRPRGRGRITGPSQNKTRRTGVARHRMQFYWCSYFGRRGAPGSMPPRSFAPSAARPLREEPVATANAEANAAAASALLLLRSRLLRSGLLGAAFFAGAFLAAGLRVAVLANVLLLSMMSRESAHAQHCNSGRGLISR